MSRLEQLLNFLRESPNDAFLTFAIAKEYEGLGDCEKALDFYSKLSSENESYVGTYYHLGKLHEKMGHPETALAVYKKGMEIAQKLGDRHAFSELAAAKMEISDEE